MSNIEYDAPYLGEAEHAELDHTGVPGVGGGGFIFDPLTTFAIETSSPSIVAGEVDGVWLIPITPFDVFYDYTGSDTLDDLPEPFSWSEDQIGQNLTVSESGVWVISVYVIFAQDDDGTGFIALSMPNATKYEYARDLSENGGISYSFAGRIASYTYTAAMKAEDHFEVLALVKGSSTLGLGDPAVQYAIVTFQRIG